MNATTQTEARAVNTAASSAANVLQAADPSKHMILVPLSRLVLRPTGRNVRKTAPRWPSSTTTRASPRPSPNRKS